MRFDFLFSYWIFIWYFFYIFGVTTFNPKIALVIAILQNMILLSIMFYVNQSWFNLITFCIVNIIVKIIPFWTLRHTMYLWKDFYALAYLFMIYVGWLYVNNQLTSRVLKQLIDRLYDNKPIGPFTYYVDKYLKV